MSASPEDCERYPVTLQEPHASSALKPSWNRSLTLNVLYEIVAVTICLFGLLSPVCDMVEAAGVEPRVSTDSA
jgi:hypothetical protein